MVIVEITWRHRNDFAFVAHCNHCGRESRWPDGYADSYYQQCVIPNRKCPHCAVSEVEYIDIKQASLPVAPFMLEAAMTGEG